MMAEPIPGHRLFSFSTFESQFRPQAEMRHGTWDEIVNGYFRKPFIRDSKDGPMFSPAIYGDSPSRANENVIAVSMLVYDFDSEPGNESLPGDHEDNLDGLARAWYSTFSHKPDAPRWRLVLPLNRDVLPHEYEAVWQGGRVLLGNDTAIDEACSDISRAYWLMSCKPGSVPHAFRGSAEGAFADPDYLIDLSGQVVKPPPPPPEPAPDAGDLEPATDAMRAEIKSMLSYLNPGMRYQEWRDVGFAIHSLNDDSLFEIWHDWSRGGSNYRGPKATRYTWDSFRNEKDRKKNYTHLDWLARKAGWTEGAEPGDGTLQTLEAIDAGNLGTVEPEAPEWAWTDWMMKGYVTGIFAAGAVGKSQMVLQLAVCRAAQIPFLDGVVPPPGGTLLLFCEDDIKIVNYRLHKVMQRYGLDWSAIKGKVYILCRVGANNVLMTFDRSNVGTVTPFWHQIADLIRRTGVDLFIADTRNDVFAGSELDNSQATQFVHGALGGLAHMFNISVGFLAHVSMGGKTAGTGTSGGLSWVNAARGQIYMKKEEPSSKLITIARQKANQSEGGVEFEAWNDGGYLVPAAQIDLNTRNEEQARLDFLAILERQKGNEQYYSFDKRAGRSYAPAEFSRISIQLKKWKTTKVSDFEGAMEQLVDMGELTRWSDPYGNVKHRIWRKEWDEQED
jgi:hypothetical protein